MISFLRYWLPLLFWMFIIFSASADTQSTQRTSRFLEPFLRWIWPDISPEQIDGVRWIIRKMAHLTEFAILAWLWWRALRKPARKDDRPWSWRTAGMALGAVVIYAASDEFHQTFVANRTEHSVMSASTQRGGLLGLGLIWIIHRLRHRGEAK